MLCHPYYQTNIQFLEKITGKRQKQATPLILSGLASLGGTIIKGLNPYLNHKRNAPMSNAVKQLYKNDRIFHDGMLIMLNRTALLAETQPQKVSNIRENINRFDEKLNQTNWQFYVFMEETERIFRRTYSAINNHHLAIKILTRYFLFHITNMCKYIDFYRQYAVTLEVS